MPKIFQFWVYIITNEWHTVLYIGMTNDIARRIYEHENDMFDGFSKRYKLHKLVYAEEFKYVNNAIAREKAMKKWNREWKNRLITESNPSWQNLKQMLIGKAA